MSNASNTNRPTQYRSYNEKEVIQEIKRLRMEGFNDVQIREFLKMPQSTFYDYVKRMYEQDRKLYEENKKHAQDMLREEVQYAKDRLLLILREAYESYKKADNGKERAEFLKIMAEVSKDLGTLAFEKPVVTGEKIENGVNGSSSDSTKEQQQQAEEQRPGATNAQF